MEKGSYCKTILFAEDDEDDRLLIKDALDRIERRRNIYFFENGEELLNYLYHDGKFKNYPDTPRPDLIFSDIRMPKKGGIATIQKIKRDPNFWNIPIIVLTASRDENDIRCCYELGISGYIVKPNSFNELVDIMNTVDRYWFEIVELPPNY